MRSQLTRKCPWCDEVIDGSDRVAEMPVYDAAKGRSRCEQFHVECYVRMMVGSIGHLRQTCSCYGGGEHDPTNLTKRQAAWAAFWEWRKATSFDPCAGTGFTNPLRFAYAEERGEP